MSETLEERIKRVALNAQYWFDAARAEPDRDRAVTHMAQAMFAWRNAAYAMKRELSAHSQGAKEAVLNCAELNLSERQRSKVSALFGLAQIRPQHKSKSFTKYLDFTRLTRRQWRLTNRRLR